jgi:hypothetical protein
MTSTKFLTVVSSLLLMTGFTLNASASVLVTLVGTGGVNNGSDDVLPYYLSINGGAPIAADCYDIFHAVTVGESWTANIDTLAQAASSGMFSGNPGALAGYELIGVLSTLAALTPQSDIDLQEDIWNVFDPGAFSISPGMAAFLATATAEMPTFNFSNVEFIEPDPGQDVQGFVTLTRFDTTSTPEPASILLLGTGLIAAGWIRRRTKV